MDIIYHYPHELTQLLIQAIPRLCRSKTDVILFFKGAGVPKTMYEDLEQQVKVDRESIKKHEITREILQRLNEAGESTLRERREVLKRVTEIEDFSTCWPNDQLEAKGLVSEIRKVVNVKDSFTRMRNEAENTKKEQREKYLKEVSEKKRKNDRIEKVRCDIIDLFSMNDNPQKRGKKLETILNEMFLIYGILIRESFSLVDVDDGGIYEQIDGVISVDGEVYLVEMKWTKYKIGRDEISNHLVRVFNRGCSRGIFISVNGYTEPAIKIVKESLHQSVFILADLGEINLLLEKKQNLIEFLRRKRDIAVVDKNPYKRIIEII